MKFRLSNELPVRGAASIAALSLFLAACGSDPAKPPAREAVQAPTAVVRARTVPSSRVIAGTVRSANVSPLSARVVGNVVRVHVAEGDRVKRGQLLVEIDSREGQAQAGAAASSVAAARANATNAETTWQRYAALRARSSVSQQELDDVKARRDAARAELERTRAMADQARTFLDDSAVRSPVDGIVTARLVDPGAQATPGMPLVVVEDSAQFRVEVMVPEHLVVRAGDPVRLEWSGGSRQSVVTRVQPNVDASTRSSLVQINVGDALRSGTFVHVHFRSGDHAALVVPPGAIVRRGALTTVFVVGNDGVARMRLITLGANDEVLSGLDDGERVVTEPSRVTDGARVS
jgi:RND family efflux transporter MFP subunit